MPTFQSIPIHPSVRSRLDGSQQQDDGACDSGSRPSESRQQQNPQQQPMRSGVSIPRSLLTRDLNDLVDLVSKGNVKNEEQRAAISEQMEVIRFQVACRMISKTRNGKRLAFNHQHGRKRHKPLVPGGSVSALDAWRSECEMHRKSENQPQIFSTGCSDLDKLVAFPTEYIMAPGGNRDPLVSGDEDFVSGEARGIPRGYVLKLSGAQGKTQVALQLASQALIQFSRLSAQNHNRIRYCYSTAGHSGRSLAQRLFQLVEKNIGDKRMLKDAAKKIEFQPISTVSQLTSTIAKLEQQWASADEKSTVSMLVLDALPLMLVEGENVNKIKSLERSLKRLARHYCVLVVIVTTTTTTGGSSSIYDNAMSPDIHLQLQKRTPKSVSIQLMCHPTKPVTKNDRIVYTPPTFNS